MTIYIKILVESRTDNNLVIPLAFLDLKQTETILSLKLNNYQDLQWIKDKIIDEINAMQLNIKMPMKRKSK